MAIRGQFKQPKNIMQPNTLSDDTLYVIWSNWVFTKESKSATMNIFHFFYFVIKSFVKVELSYVFTINLFTIAENCTENTHHHNSSLIRRTVSCRVDEVIPSDHPRRYASRVIQWYGLIHETWYCTPDQVPIMIICLLYAFFLTFFLILKPVLVFNPEKLREHLQ